MLAMNVQILRHTEYKNTSTEPPQILLSDLRFYCPTSEFTVRPQNLQYDLRIYSTTSESTVRPQNLQYDLRIYSTTSEFYCPTWVFGSSNFSTTWPGGSVLFNRDGATSIFDGICFSRQFGRWGPLSLHVYSSLESLWLDLTINQENHHCCQAFHGWAWERRPKRVFKMGVVSWDDTPRNVIIDVLLNQIVYRNLHLWYISSNCCVTKVASHGYVKGFHWPGPLEANWRLDHSMLA